MADRKISAPGWPSPLMHDDFMSSDPFSMSNRLRYAQGRPMNWHHPGTAMSSMDDFSLPYWARPRWPVARVNDAMQEMHIPDFGVERQVMEVNNKDDCFQVRLDVSQYKPDEIEVKTVGNEVIIKAVHEERQDEHGYVSRTFSRRYLLPDDAKSENVISKLSKDGFLTVEVPKASAITGERKIPIQAEPGH